MKIIKRCGTCPACYAIGYNASKPPKARHGCDKYGIKLSEKNVFNEDNIPKKCKLEELKYD